MKVKKLKKEVQSFFKKNSTTATALTGSADIRKSVILNKLNSVLM